MESGYFRLMLSLVHPGTWFIRSRRADLTYNLLLTLLPGAIKQIRKGSRVVVETPRPDLFLRHPQVDVLTTHHLYENSRFVTPRVKIVPATGTPLTAQILESLAQRVSPSWNLNGWDARNHLDAWKRIQDEEQERIDELKKRFRTPRVFLTREELDTARKTYSTPYIAICPKSDQLSAAGRRDWATESFNAVRNGLREHVFLQIGTPDTPLLPNVQDARGLSDRKNAAILANALFYVGPDGGLMHLNKAVGKRAAIVYGGAVNCGVTDYIDDITFFSTPECSPCFRSGEKMKPCPNRMGCMNSITPQEVVERIRQNWDALCTRSRDDQK